MSAWRRIGAGTIALLTVSLTLTSCSLEPGSNPAGPSNSLDRRSNDLGVLMNPNDCSIVANDIFGDGGSLPFMVTCEDMNEAEVTPTTASYNNNGCMVSMSGEVYFPSSDHLYTYTATTSDCQHDGGALKVCASHWRGCVTARLPHLAIIDVHDLRAPTK